jgi:hypothetical protein
MKQIALLALLFAGLTQASTVWFAGMPSSVNAGDTFDLQVGLTPNAGEQINSFSIDLEYSSILSVTIVTEDGYFAANGFAWSPGTPGSTGSPDVSLLASISDLLFTGDFLPSPDTLFDVVFTATDAGPIALTLGPGSFLQDTSSNAVPIDAVINITPEPSAALLGASGLAILAALGWRRRRT